jgi:hypothetical protein
MKTRIFSVLGLLVLCGAFSTWGGGLGVAAATTCTCTATGFHSSPTSANPALTACVVNPTGTFSATLNATGCDIGVYYEQGHSGR